MGLHSCVKKKRKSKSERELSKAGGRVWGRAAGGWWRVGAAHCVPSVTSSHPPPLRPPLHAGGSLSEGHPGTQGRAA